MSMQANTKHLLLRTGFGPAPTDPDEVEVSTLLGVEASRPIDVVERIRPGELTNESKRKELIQQIRAQVLKLNQGWMKLLTAPESRLREKMTLFWHDHFACRVRAPFLAQQNNNVLREHALGNFRTLLTSISKDPAMLQFLNNQQNKKDSPNENFAREVMELFTLGRGNYSESDIKAAARAFTGWAFNPLSGEFVFRDKVHDGGVKTFLGKTGRFNGDDVISMILDKRATATFIAEKVYCHFVDVKPDRDAIETLAKHFYESDYSISGLMKELLTMDIFYDERHRGNRIKSPVELLTGFLTQTGGVFENPDAPIFIQRALGQVLFFPPNVGGWPAGTGWIDSSSLTFRLALPSAMFDQTEINIEAKDDGDVNNATNTAGARRLSMRVDWALLAKKFGGDGTPATVDNIEAYLLPQPSTEANRNMVRKYAGKSGSEAEVVRKACIALMALPEYQMS
ncbi:DUF1800 domain-containing protein [Chryseolinea sp. T2]|uniref:DUF1800 domain-containing protein n=1 Tax=Chryseolinea sp. T2 TaxID=3129255 RepID=UPI003076D121